MARCRFRYTVRLNGIPVQNAKVYFYETGTTTPTSDVFGAASGGSAILTGLSNDQGEVVGYKTSAADIDCKITDNSQAAYYPSAVTSMLHWTDFTETVTVIPPGADLEVSRVVTAGPLNINVQSHASWDPIASDNITALQATADAAQAAGGVMQMPAADYKMVANGILVPQGNGFTIQGDGDGTRLVNNTAGTTKTTLALRGTPGTFLQGMVVRNLLLDSDATRGNIHLDIYGVSRGVFENIDCERGGGVGTRLQFSNNVETRNCTNGYNASFGCLVRRDCNALKMLGGRDHHNILQGWYLDAGAEDGTHNSTAGVYLLGRIMEGNRKEGILIAPDSGEAVGGFYFAGYCEGNNAGGVKSAEILLDPIGTGQIIGYEIGPSALSTSGTAPNALSNYGVLVNKGSLGRIGPIVGGGFNTRTVGFGTGIGSGACELIDPQLTYAGGYTGRSVNNLSTIMFLRNLAAASNERELFVAGRVGLAEEGGSIRIKSDSYDREMLAWADPGPSELGILALMNLAGVYSNPRLKVGAAGTGPGGVGKAVYVS